MNLWEYMLHYVYRVADIPESPEAVVAMGSGDMIVSLLVAILVMMQHQEPIAHASISITVKSSHNSRATYEDVPDIVLLTRLLWATWVRVTSSSIFNREVLAEISHHSCAIENLITANMSVSDLFWSTIQELAAGYLASKRCVTEPEEEKVSRRIFFLRKKKPKKSGQERTSRPARTEPRLSESPWRKYKEQGSPVVT